MMVDTERSCAANVIVLLLALSAAPALAQSPGSVI